MKKAFRINIKNVHVAFLTSDTAEGALHEDPKHVAGAMQIQLAPRVKEGNLYGDGRRRDAIRKVDGYDVTFENNKLPPSILARMRGQQVGADGVRRSNASDQAAEFAIGFEVEQTGGERELTWLPKCTAAPSNRDLQQQTDNINYSTDTLTVAAIALEYNGDFEYTVDTADTETPLAAGVVDDWFKAVPVKPPGEDNGGTGSAGTSNTDGSGKAGADA